MLDNKKLNHKEKRFYLFHQFCPENHFPLNKPQVTQANSVSVVINIRICMEI